VGKLGFETAYMRKELTFDFLLHVLCPILVQERVCFLSLEHIDAERVFETGGEAMMTSGYLNSMTDTTKKGFLSHTSGIAFS